MIRRLYAHNFRCLQNFTLDLGNLRSALLIGNNGAGKTTVLHVLEKLQAIAAGSTRVGSIITPRDCSFSNVETPIRFELEAEIAGELFVYRIAFELPEGYREMRIAEEHLSRVGVTVFERERARVQLPRVGNEREVVFNLDWHSVGLSVIQLPAHQNSIRLFQQWLSRALILRPVPQLVSGDSDTEVLQPKPDVSDFGNWFSGVLAQHPAAYNVMHEYLRSVMPDLSSIRNPSTGRETRSLAFRFKDGQRELEFPFASLSDGEKCLAIGAMVLATRHAEPSTFCFWDEPDNYLSLAEVSQVVFALRREFNESGQFLATSHNPEAIRAFSDENTFVLQRRSHGEPTVVRQLSELEVPGDLVNALIRGDVGA